MTVLHYAARNGTVEGVDFLLLMGVDANAPTRSMWTPLHTAAYSGHVDACASLVRRGGADVQAKDKDGCDPISPCVSDDARRGLPSLLTHVPWLAAGGRLFIGLPTEGILTSAGP